jgi:hypothetical protein
MDGFNLGIELTDRITQFHIAQLVLNEPLAKLLATHGEIAALAPYPMADSHSAELLPNAFKGRYGNGFALGRSDVQHTATVAGHGLSGVPVCGRFLEWESALRASRSVNGGFVATFRTGNWRHGNVLTLMVVPRRKAVGLTSRSSRS